MRLVVDLFAEFEIVSRSVCGIDQVEIRRSSLGECRKLTNSNLSSCIAIDLDGFLSIVQVNMNAKLIKLHVVKMHYDSVLRHTD